MITAGFAQKLALAFSIPLGFMSTPGTPGRCMLRVNRDARNASKLALILNENPQLPKWPAVEHSPHLLGCLYAAADSLKILHSQGGVSILGQVNNQPTDFVVQIPHPSFLSSRKAFQHFISIGRAIGLLLLKLCSLLRIVITNKTSLFSSDKGGIGESHQLGQAEVYADNALGKNWLWAGDFNRHVEVPVPVRFNQIASPMFKIKHILVSWGDMIGKVKTYVLKVKDKAFIGKAILRCLEAGHLAISWERLFPLLSTVGAVGFDGLVLGGYNAIRLQVGECSRRFAVIKFMELTSPSSLCLLTFREPPGDTFREASLITKESLSLSNIGDFKPDRYPHRHILPCVIKYAKSFATSYI